MKGTSQTEKSTMKIGIAIGLIAALIIWVVGLLLGPFFQGWYTKPVAALPFLFWVYYTILVGTFVAILIIPDRNEQRMFVQHSILDRALIVIQLFFGIMLMSGLFVDREWDGQRIISPTMGLFIFLLSAKRLISLFLARTRAKSKVSRN